MKTFLQISACLCTFLGFTQILTAQSCPTNITRTCFTSGISDGVRVEMELDIADCADAPPPGDVVYSEEDGTPGNSPFINTYSSDITMMAPHCQDNGSTITQGYEHSSSGCDASEAFTLEFSFNHTGGSGEVTCEYSAAGARILPVELIYFTSELREESIRLHWQTAVEINNEGFFIEHSTDGKNWMELDFINGVGDSNDLNSCEFTDREPIKGATNYYRLRQMDFDGKQDVSNVTSEFVAGEGTGQINVFPNPTSDGQINIEFHFNDSKETTLRLIDGLGRTVLTNKINVLDKGQRQTLDVSNVVAGNYFLMIQTATQTFHKKVSIH